MPLLSIMPPISHVSLIPIIPLCPPLDLPLCSSQPLCSSPKLPFFAILSLLCNCTPFPILTKITFHRFSMYPLRALLLWHRQCCNFVLKKINSKMGNWSFALFVILLSWHYSNDHGLPWVMAGDCWKIGCISRKTKNLLNTFYLKTIDTQHRIWSIIFCTKDKGCNFAMGSP